jgi:hypothetical protein
MAGFCGTSVAIRVLTTTFEVDCTTSPRLLDFEEKNVRSVVAGRAVGEVSIARSGGSRWKREMTRERRVDPFNRLWVAV